MAGGNNRRTFDDRETLVAFLGEAWVRALEERGLQISIEIESEGADIDAAMSEVRDHFAGNRDAEVEAQRLMALGELGAGVVHEVRNHVTSIRGFAQVGRRRVDEPEEIRRILETVDHESARCVDTLSSFLGFARKRDNENTDFDASAAVERAAKLVRHQLAVNDVRLELEPVDAPLPVHGNCDAVIQVLVNLALNAQQAMSDGGSVHMSARAGSDGGVDIIVTDTGPGVAKHLRERIFEPFFTTKADGKGTGLGLAISARIAAEQGGSLALVDSAKGARFVLHLPGADR